VLGLFTAVHGTLGFVTWRALVDAEATRADAAAWHAGVLGVALVMRAVIGWRRRLSWGFFERAAHAVPQPRMAGDR